MSTRGIPKHKFTRAATLAGTGAKMGGNYARYYAEKAAGREDRGKLDDKNARAAYQAFSTLRGGPLKVAQMLSIDEHILPTAYRKQFQQAQYAAPSLSFPLVVRMFKRSLGQHPETLFDRFSREAEKAASIGQVHLAEKGNKRFAVKIQYPGVAQSLKSDLALIRPIAQRVLDMRSEVLERFIGEAEARLLEECNYELELKRSIDLSTRSNHINGLKFPTYHPGLSGTHVITMDWMEGEQIDQWLATSPSQSARNKVGQALWDFYQHQIHELRSFHADPHPGNFLIDHSELVVIDFGCVKEMDPDFHRAYFRLLTPGLLADTAAFAEALHELELILPGDSNDDQQLIMEAIAESVELLGRPYLQSSFDFGDPTYLESIYEMGERNRQDGRYDHIDRSRGPAESLYVNRTYFGLYSLLGQIGANIETRNIL